MYIDSNTNVFSYLKLLSEVQYHITLCHTALTLLAADTVGVTIHQCIYQFH